MKGVVFTEFIEMVEAKFGFEMADTLLSQPGLKSKGVYTAVGTYDFQEMVIMLSALSEKIKIPVPELLKTFGYHLFFRLTSLYPHFNNGVSSAFEFLSNIEDYIHVEVLKLYPDAELPSIRYQIDKDETKMLLTYQSDRKLGDLAIGLIQGCVDHYQENIEIKVLKIKEGGRVVEFLLQKK